MVCPEAGVRIEVGPSFLPSSLPLHATRERWWAPHPPCPALATIIINAGAAAAAAVIISSIHFQTSFGGGETGGCAVAASQTDRDRVCVRACVHDAPEIDAAVAAAAAANVYLHEIVREYCVIARQHRRPGVPADQIRSDGGDVRVRQSVPSPSVRI